jgi:sulfate adenylyltransferase
VVIDVKNGGLHMTDAIAPHGGTLVDRTVPPPERDRLERAAAQMPALRLDRRALSDLEMIVIGGFSPLEGFMEEPDYERVVADMRLANGLPWSIPVTLAASEDDGRRLTPGDDVALCDETGTPLAVLTLRAMFRPDKQREAQAVYRTTDQAHPGVQALYAQGPVYLGGPVTLLRHPPDLPFPEHRLEPRQTRALFRERTWRRIVAFQTRNPVHRAHEYIQKCALEIVDGLLLHPLVGETKGDDIPADVRMECYQVLLERYYPPDRTVLSVLPANMRYAGPREAIFHAIMRKNYGCTHFIVGRDHAGVGTYYGTYDAHYIFDEFAPADLGITPLFFDHTFFCRRCESMASTKSCPHGPEEHVALSGTKVREMLARGERPPHEFSRPEVADVLIRAMRAG